MADDCKDIPVVVAVRCRPLVSKEINDGSKQAVEFSKDKTQINLSDVGKSFTYDFVFPPNSTQDEVYAKCGQKLISNIFKGYNATILAYGQTGSGKTFTMGTSYSERLLTNLNEKGIIPRVVSDIFKVICEKSETHIFSIRVSFLEVYNESIFDLFNTAGIKEVSIREDLCGIKVVGLKELTVECEKDVLALLETGTCNRKTGQTNMNEQSSRSHALFTLTMEQRCKSDPDYLVSSKFHLVDLAGSERAKKTGASGARFREGIHINRGLLALGNVISALCDRNSHIPYRDSKLTRLLQDSLGGNSYTVMVACISPADSNLEETLNTLRYADRARKIKNKPIVNIDPRLKEIDDLKKLILSNQILWSNHMAKCPLKDDQSFQNITKLEVGDEGLEIVQNNGGLNYLRQEDEDDRVLNDIYNQEGHDLIRRLNESNSDKTRLTQELRRSMNQISKFCVRLIDSENHREMLKSQLKAVSEKTENTLTEISEIDCDESSVQAIKQKLASVITESMEVMKQATPDRTDLMNMEDNSEGNSSTEENGIEASVAISKELETVDQELSRKQSLFLRLLECKEEVATVTPEDLAKVEFLSAEVQRLKKERDEEMSIVIPSTNKDAVAKMSEDRRKKIRKLEDQLGKMQRELDLKSKQLELKKEQDRRMKNLEKEIKDLKRARVSLMRKMEFEAKRVFELQRKIKTQDVRFQNEQMRNKMLLNKNKEETIQLARKLKAAQSAKQKLEASLAKKNDMAKDRALNQSKYRGQVNERIKSWLNQEIDVEVNRLEAKKHVELLKDKRAELGQELEMLQEDLEDLSVSPSKKRLSGESFESLKIVDSSDICKKRLELEQDIARIKCSMEDFTASIKAIHQDVLTEPDDLALNEKSRWNELKNSNEYKYSLSFLFDMVLQQSSMVHDLTRDVNEALNTNEGLKRDLDQSFKRIKEAEFKAQQEISLLTDRHTKEVTILLEKLNGISKPDHSSSSIFGSETMAFLKQRLQNKDEEVKQLQTELSLAKSKKQKIERKTKPVLKFQEVFETESSEELSYEESDGDPEWHKTPLQKRTRRTILVKSNKENTSDSGNDTNNKKSLKRAATGGFCSCKGSCKTNHCGCRRGSRFCSSSCKCTDECLNVDACASKDSNSATLIETSESVFNTTFVNNRNAATSTPNQEGNRRRSPRSTEPLNSTVTLDFPNLTYNKPFNSSFFKPIEKIN